MTTNLIKTPFGGELTENIHKRERDIDEVSMMQSKDKPFAFVSSRKARELTEKNLERLSQITKRPYKL